jgi:hypothetical protein
MQRVWSIGHRVEDFYSLLYAYVGCGLGRRPAALAISETFSSHSIAIICIPRTPGISRNL